MLTTPKLTLSFVLSVLACRVAGQAATPATTTEGLVGYWNFDEGSGTTANDGSGNGNSGAVVNALWASGKFGGALDFTGGQGYVSIGHDIPLVSASLEFWIYPHANTGNDSIILNYGNSGVDFRILGDGSLSASAGGVAITAPGFSFYAQGNSDRWYHIAYTFDASTHTHTLHRNGVPVASGANTQTIASNGVLWIGRNAGYDFVTFQGLLDEAKIYNRALSAAEVLAEYIATPPVTPTS